VDIRKLTEVLVLITVTGDGQAKKRSHWVVHLPDCERILTQAALEKITRIDVESCHVHLEDGTAIACDLMVGADGISSPIGRPTDGDRVMLIVLLHAFNPKPEPRYPFSRVHRRSHAIKTHGLWAMPSAT